MYLLRDDICQGSVGEPGPTGAAGFPGTPVSGLRDAAAWKSRPKIQVIKAIEAGFKTNSFPLSLTGG